jgi:hypothetical protein
MKMLITCMSIAVLSIAFIPAHSETISPITPTTTTTPAEAEAARVLIKRLDEINAMDKSVMSAPEKKALRKEVRTIKKELNTNGGGVYLSVGALLLVIILLIVLL